MSLNVQTSPLAVGSVVALTLCPTLDDAPVSGLWEILDFEMEDYSAGIRGSTFTLTRPQACVNVEHNGIDCFELPEAERCENCQEVMVDADELEAQVMPKEVGKRMADERWMELAAEDEL